MNKEIIDHGFGVIETRETFYTEETIRQKDQKIADLETKLADMTKKYELASLPMGGLVDTARNLEKQLKTQPAEIVEKIRNFCDVNCFYPEFVEREHQELVVSYTKSVECLKNILKEYGER